MNDFSSKRLLLTGAAGFVGVNLAIGFTEAGYEVHSTLRPGSDLWRIRESGVKTMMHELDLRSAEKVDELFEKVQPSIVVHAAAARGNDWDSDKLLEAFQSTVGGTFNILLASANVQIEKFIHIGSSLVYSQSDTPHYEYDERKPESIRGVLKHSAALLARQFSIDRNLNIIDLILYRVYGPYEQREKFIPQAILKSLNGGFLPLTEAGLARNYIHVEDVVKACLLAAELESVGFSDFNIASEEEHLNEEVIKILEGITGKIIEVQQGKYPVRPMDNGHWHADITKARQILDWKPSHTLEEGLQKTIEWFESEMPDYYLKGENSE